MAYEKILYEKAPPIGRIVLNQPEKRNMLNIYRLEEVKRAAKEMEMDEDIKVIIIKGAGPCFSSGYDITPGKEGKGTLRPVTGVYVNPDRDRIWGNYNRHHLDVYFTLLDLQKPVIAQIHSWCLAGGTELAAFCDMRVLSDDAMIGWPVGRNWSPGNIPYFTWYCGVTKAKEFYMTCDPMNAQEAWRVGWGTRIYPKEKLTEETEKLAKQIAEIPTDLIMFTKRSINSQLDVMGFRTGLMWGSEILSLQGFRKSNENEAFRQIAESKGLKAALDWRDSGRGAYRQSDKAVTAREAKK